MPVENHPTVAVVEPHVARTYTSDGSGSAMDAVKWDSANNQVTPVTAAGDRIFGILKNTPESAGDEVTVCREGVLRSNIADAASAGDPLAPSGSANGELGTDGATAPSYRAEAELHEGELVAYLS